MRRNKPSSWFVLEVIQNYSGDIQQRSTKRRAEGVLSYATKGLKGDDFGLKWCCRGAFVPLGRRFGGILSPENARMGRIGTVGYNENHHRQWVHCAEKYFCFLSKKFLFLLNCMRFFSFFTFTIPILGAGFGRDSETNYYQQSTNLNYELFWDQNSH